HQQQRRKLTDIVRPALERQPQHAQPLTAESPEHATHLAQEPVPLLFVNANYFFQQPEVISTFLRDRPERHQVFRKARPPITDPWIHESRPDPRIRSAPV